MPDANSITIPFPVCGLHLKQTHEATPGIPIASKNGRHQSKQHGGTIGLQVRSTATSITTYYYRTSLGIHGSTTNFGTIPANSVLEAQVTT